MTKQWTKFKMSFTEEQREAIWQYVIDHSQIQPNGYHGIQFYIRNQDDLWERLHARYTGQFNRYDKLEKQNQSDRQALVYANKMGYKNDKIAKEIKASGNLYKKLILFIYRKSRDYLFK